MSVTDRIHRNQDPVLFQKVHGEDHTAAGILFFGKDVEEQILRIGTPAERSLFGMPMLPPVLQPERKACGQGGD